MQFRVVVKSISPCSCQHEGEAEVFIPEYNITIVCCFVGNADSFVESFPLNIERKANISLWFANWRPTKNREKSIVKTVRGVYDGFELDEDGDKIFKVNSLLPVYSDNELGNYDLEVPINSWVESAGQFYIEEI